MRWLGVHTTLAPAVLTLLLLYLVQALLCFACWAVGLVQAPECWLDRGKNDQLRKEAAWLKPFLNLSTLSLPMVG